MITCRGIIMRRTHTATGWASGFVSQSHDCQESETNMVLMMLPSRKDITHASA